MYHTDIPQQLQVTHWVADQPNGQLYDVRKGANNVHIYNYSYLDACIAQGCLVSPLPKHVLHRPPAPAADPADCTLPLEDAFGDPFAEDGDAADVRELLYQVRELGRRMELAGRPAAGEMPSLWHLKLGCAPPLNQSPTRGDGGYVLAFLLYCSRALGCHQLSNETAPLSYYYRPSMMPPKLLHCVLYVLLTTLGLHHPA